MTFNQRYGPWALVTGASSGIGAEFARQLAAQTKARGTSPSSGNKNRIQVKVITADLSQPDFLSLIVSATQEIEIGLLVNNAGFGLARSFLDHELERELALLDLNCRVPLAFTHVFGRQMAERERGGIIFVSSISGYLATPYEATYGASKVYKLFLAESLAMNLKRMASMFWPFVPDRPTLNFMRSPAAVPWQRWQCSRLSLLR